MIIYNEKEIKELNSENATELIIDNIACYVFVGGNPGGTEGSVYVFQLDGDELKVFSGNIFDDNLLKESLIGILPQIEIFYDRWNFEKHRDGWTQLPFVMGHYAFIRDFMVDDITENWKSVEARYHFERLVKGVALTVSQHEEEMRNFMKLKDVDESIPERKMDDDQKIIVEYLLKYSSTWRDSKGLKAILADCVPDKKVIRNILISAFEEGIYEELRSAKNYKFVIYKYKRILCEDYGIGEKYANWAIDTWLFVSGVDFVENEISEATNHAYAMKVTDPKIEIMDIDELELNPRTNNALKVAGINTVGDLARLSATEMADIRFLGRRALIELLGKIKILGVVFDSQTEEEYIEQWSKRKDERIYKIPRVSYADAYDEFIEKNKKSSVWDFEDVIIHRKLGWGQYVNTYFCQYDNPPIEIIGFTAKKEGNKYEMRVRVRNLSNETRNQPIRIRYKIQSRNDTYHIHDYVDTVTPAPKNQELVIRFECEGEEKPIFSIIE